MGKYSHLSDSEKRKLAEELKQKINESEGKYNYFKAMQLALKLILNGTYGALCHPAFPVSNTDIANSITSLAREVINYMLDNIEDYYYNKWGLDKEIHDLLGDVYISELDGGFYVHRRDGLLIDNYPRKTDDNSTGVDKIMTYYYLTKSDIVPSDKEIMTHGGKEYKVIHKCHIHDFSKTKPLPTNYSVEPDENSSNFDKKRGVRASSITIYGDTDSVDYQTLIKTIDNESVISELTVEELYNKNVINGSAGITLKGHESVNCTDKVLNYGDDGKLYYAPVKRIIRHKVTKNKWKLKTKSGKEIIITNDHSMIVFRDGVKLEVKPCDVLKTDKILVVVVNK